MASVAEDLAKPVIALAPGARLRGEVLYGTAFPVGGPLFLTAGHVVENLRAAGGDPFIGHAIWGMRAAPGQAVGWNQARVVQAWPDVDLALLEVTNSRAQGNPSPHWRVGVIPMLDSVSTLGYPYGLNREKLALTVRGFAGHVVSGVPFDRLPGKPQVYELSFQAPRGLSGGALVWKGAIAGCVIGNATTKMMVFADEERVEDAGTVTRVERYEALHLGIAIRADVILALPCPGGGTVRDQVIKYGGAAAIA